MAVTAADLVLVGCENHAEDDASAQGGAIAKGKLLYFSNADISAIDEVEAVADEEITATIRIHGRNAVGAQISEDLEFSAEEGPKTTTLEFERIEKAVIFSGSLPSSATVTIRKESNDAEILKLYGASVSPSGTAITEVRKMFIGASVPPSGSNVYYEKAYWLNAHGVDALGDPIVKEFADPRDAFAFAIETAANGSRSIANRITAPTGLAFNDANKSFSPATLGAGDGIPVWVKATIPSTESARKTYVTLRIEGTTS